MNVNRFVIDGLNELKSVSIGMKSFYHDWGFVKKGSKCAIMNCNKLIEIYIGSWSINLYESFELKNLLSLISIQLDDYALMFCHAIVFESMNHWMNDNGDLIQLQSIIFGYRALFGDYLTGKKNKLIMKSANCMIIITTEIFLLYL